MDARVGRHRRNDARKWWLTPRASTHRTCYVEDEIRLQLLRIAIGAVPRTGTPAMSAGQFPESAHPNQAARKILLIHTKLPSRDFQASERLEGTSSRSDHHHGARPCCVSSARSRSTSRYATPGQSAPAPSDRYISSRTACALAPRGFSRRASTHTCAIS